MKSAPYEAKNKLSSYIDLASQGKKIWITKHGKRMALLSSGLDLNSETPQDLVQQFRALRLASQPSSGSLKELIDEGRT